MPSLAHEKFAALIKGPLLSIVLISTPGFAPLIETQEEYNTRCCKRMSNLPARFAGTTLSDMTSVVRYRATAPARAVLTYRRPRGSMALPVKGDTSTGSIL